MRYISIINLILLSIIFIFGCIRIIKKHKIKINRYLKKKQVFRFIVNTVIPFVVPLIISVLTLVPGGTKDVNTTDWIVTIALLSVASINLIAQYGIWLAEKKEVDIRWENQAARFAFNNLFEVYGSTGDGSVCITGDGLREP